MELISTFYAVSLFVQLVHSAEELSTGFHKKWYLSKMPFKYFLAFEVLFSLFWVSILLLVNFPAREQLQAFFLLLMFANGVQHLIWWGVTKKYVPGLVTAFAHIAVFMTFYFMTIF